MNDQADVWWNDLVAEQGSVAAANALLATFDVWDRYDSDGDGNFDEPDGYIDHFQSVHAGEGEETGGGAQGTNAIWSHRWYAYSGSRPRARRRRADAAFGGVRIGDSNYWIGDYTIEPENGGVGVFAHEFAHDLNIPDLYDTSGNTGGAENSTGWWTLMSQGSYGTIQRTASTSARTPVALRRLGEIPARLPELRASPAPTTRRHVQPGPAEFNTRRRRRCSSSCPTTRSRSSWERPARAVARSSTTRAAPATTSNNTMTSTVTPSGGALTAKVRYEIEPDWDYAFLEVIDRRRDDVAAPSAPNLLAYRQRRAERI